MSRAISEGTFYRWKAKYGGMDVNQLRRLQQLEDENRTERTVRSANAHLRPLPSSAPERVFLLPRLAEFSGAGRYHWNAASDLHK